MKKVSLFNSSPFFVHLIKFDVLKWRLIMIDGLPRHPRVLLSEIQSNWRLFSFCMDSGFLVPRNRNDGCVFLIYAQ